MSELRILAVASVLEATRSGFVWLAAASIAGSLALAVFVSQIALTESVSLGASIGAALLRASAVFLIVVQVAASTARQHAEKSIELLLSLPLSRTTYFIGRWTGYVLLSTGLAALCTVALLPWSRAVGAAVWGVSLAIELGMMAAAALFFSMALVHVLPAVGTCAAFYLLARAIGSIQLIATGPATVGGWLHDASRTAIDAIALMLPRLDDATRAEWLVYEAPAPADLLGLLGGLVLYATLLLCAGLIDFHRRNL